MANHEQRPILVCNIGWMARYEGLVAQPDKIVGGGQYVIDEGRGHECCNFLSTQDGTVFGHFETIKKEKDRRVSLDRLGAPANAAKIEHVDVVWVATHPQERGRRVIGYYLDATVFRNRQHHAKSPTAQHRADDIKSYMVTAQSANAVLLPLGERNIRLSKGPGWIGQASWWFPETSQHADVPTFLKQVRELLEGVGRNAAKRNSAGKWGGQTDPESNSRVEEAAVAFVKAHFNDFAVKSVEKENCGWDLEVYANESTPRKSKPELVLEVKGLSSVHFQVGMTPNEFDALRRHMAGGLPHYRLCVVTDALSNNPTLRVLRYAGVEAGWADDRARTAVSLDIHEKTAAIICLNE
ncbi:MULTISPECIES: protein NO VEIN domain-containing protein [unclassified Rhodanobacter]|uniref:DUF3883 domain-containing protein n=1 Tax=Rhodanobacter humi TaxID=1888173 RepID=A0ABV4ALC3_9GAMM